MPVKIISAEERMKATLSKTSVFLLGGFGVGKTSQLFTLDADKTLALDFEAGMKSVQTWRGDCIPIRSFEDAADIACLIGGANPALPPNDLFSQAHYDHVKEVYANIDLSKYDTIFFDSLSELANAAWSHAKQQPRAFSNRGAADTRGAYGVLAENLVALVRHMQHAQAKTTIFVARLAQIKDDAGRISYEPELVGQKSGREIPGVVDAVISYSFFDYAENTGWVHNYEKGQHRAFCCHRLNPFGLPAKERSMGNVEMIEEPNLGKLIEKINAPARAAASQFQSTFPTRS